MPYQAIANGDYSKYPRKDWEKIFDDDCVSMREFLEQYIKLSKKVLNHPYDRYTHAKPLRDMLMQAMIDMGEQRESVRSSADDIINTVFNK